MIHFLWSLVVCAAVLMIVSNMMTGVRCDSFADALKTSALYAVFTTILTKVLAVPAALTTLLAGVLTFGFAMPVFAVAWGLLICGTALFLADKIVEGFEIQSYGTTVLVAFVVGIGNFVAGLLKIV